MSKRVNEYQQAAHLEEHGWVVDKEGWSHPTLAFSWPLDDAYRLQCAAERGARGLVFRDLRSWCSKQKEGSAA